MMFSWTRLVLAAVSGFSVAVAREPVKRPASRVQDTVEKVEPVEPVEPVGGKKKSFYDFEDDDDFYAQFGDFLDHDEQDELAFKDHKPTFDSKDVTALKETARKDFEEFDNGDGQLDALEVAARFGRYLNAIDLFYFYTKADKDGSGTVSYPEYEAYIMETTAEEEAKRKETSV